MSTTWDLATFTGPPYEVTENKKHAVNVNINHRMVGVTVAYGPTLAQAQAQFVYSDPHEKSR